MIEIKEIDCPEAKSDICDHVLRSLPSWFGIEASIVEYVDITRNMPFYAAFDADKPDAHLSGADTFPARSEAVGFVAIKTHNPYTAEVCVMGVLEEYHRQGLGSRLIERCERFCAESGREFLTVKTLDASRESKSYEKTTYFYAAMGFKPLEVFPTIWDEDNPCLFMVKYLGT